MHATIHFPPHLNLKMDHKPDVPPKPQMTIYKCLLRPLSYGFTALEKHTREPDILSFSIFL